MLFLAKLTWVDLKRDLLCLVYLEICLCAILWQVHDSLPDLDLDGFFCAHLTVDVNDGQRQPVLLIYDFVPVHPTLGVQAMPPRDRYAMLHHLAMSDYAQPSLAQKCLACNRYSIVQHAVQAWEGLRIGSVKIMRQWAGSLESLPQLEALRLPHARSDFVCLGDTVRYARFAQEAC